MEIEDKIENIFDQVGEGISEGFLKIHALPLYLRSEIKEDLSGKQTKLRQMASNAMEGIFISAYFLNSIHDKRWLLVPLATNIFSFYCNSYFTSYKRKNSITNHK